MIPALFSLLPSGVARIPGIIGGAGPGLPQWFMEINWPAQAFGLVGLVFLVVGYQRPRKQFLEFMIVGNVFCIAEALILGGWTGAIRLSIAIVRNVVIIAYLNKNKDTPVFWVFIFILATVSASMFFINVWYDVLPPVLSVVYTVFTIQKNYKLQKAGAFAVDSGTAVYNLFLGAYIGVFRSAFAAGAVLVSLILLLKKKSTGNGNAPGATPWQGAGPATEGLPEDVRQAAPGCLRREPPTPCGSGRESS